MKNNKQTHSGSSANIGIGSFESTNDPWFQYSRDPRSVCDVYVAAIDSDYRRNYWRKPLKYIYFNEYIVFSQTGCSCRENKMCEDMNNYCVGEWKQNTKQNI